VTRCLCIKLKMREERWDPVCCGLLHAANTGEGREDEICVNEDELNQFTSLRRTCIAGKYDGLMLPLAVFTATSRSKSWGSTAIY
jgi:hypothetical protein